MGIRYKIKTYIRSIINNIAPVPGKSPTTFYSPYAEPGPLSLIIQKIESIQGYFNEDDCMHFFMILQMQKELGIKGDIFEIGSYFGRSTALLAHCLRADETLVVCDAFESEIQDVYHTKPTVNNLKNNIQLVNPGFDFSQLDIHSCLSNELDLPNTQVFRFSHIDGGHDAETAYADISYAATRTLKNGIIAVDDYKHPDWPGVTDGVQMFLSENMNDFRIFADMNRHRAKGRKLYLIKYN